MPILRAVPLMKVSKASINGIGLRFGTEYSLNSNSYITKGSSVLCSRFVKFEPEGKAEASATLLLSRVEFDEITPDEERGAGDEK